MTQHKNVYTALASAQSEMGPVVKGTVNPHFRSKYADLADVMQVALPALNQNGVSVWSSIVPIEGTNMMRTTLSHGESDTHIFCDVPLIVSKNDMKGLKSATTYAKRVGVESLCGIAAEDDDGNAASKAAPKREAPKPPEVDPQAIKQATEYLAQADSLDDLKDRWSNLPKPTAAHADVVAAKNAAKKNLTMPDNSDIGDDQIPY